MQPKAPQQRSTITKHPQLMHCRRAMISIKQIQIQPPNQDKILQPVWLKQHCKQFRKHRTSRDLYRLAHLHWMMMIHKPCSSCSTNRLTVVARLTCKCALPMSAVGLGGCLCACPLCTLTSSWWAWKSETRSVVICCCMASDSPALLPLLSHLPLPHVAGSLPSCLLVICLSFACHLQSRLELAAVQGLSACRPNYASACHSRFPAYKKQCITCCATQSSVW